MTNQSAWSGILRFYECFSQIATVFKVINCSANFFAYQLLLFREKKMQRLRNEDREMERLEHLNASSNGTFATRETSPWSNFCTIICFESTLSILSIVYNTPSLTLRNPKLPYPTLCNPTHPHANLRSPTQPHTTPRKTTQPHATLPTVTLPNPLQPYATLHNPNATSRNPTLPQRNPTQPHAKLRNPMHGAAP